MDKMGIAIDRDSYYAPCCYLICRIIDGSWSTRDENTILVQSNLDYPSIASLFGYQNENIDEAIEIINEHLGEIVEDPGYFD